MPPIDARRTGMRLMTHAEALAEIEAHNLADYSPLEFRLLDIGFLVTRRFWYDVSPHGLGSLFFSRFVDDGAFEAPRFALLVRALLKDYDEHPEYAPTATDQALLEYIRAMLTYLRTVPPGVHMGVAAPHGEDLRCALAVHAVLNDTTPPDQFDDPWDQNWEFPEPAPRRAGTPIYNGPLAPRPGRTPPPSGPAA
jgi:hypothetical protein